MVKIDFNTMKELFKYQSSKSLNKLPNNVKNAVKNTKKE